jgi:predicted membrane protein
MAGGVSVAYVFIHVFPELEAAQATLQQAAGESLAFLEHHAYLVALAGLILFYGVERKVRSAQRERGERPGPGEGETTTGMGVFYLHISSFAVYNALIGYLLVHREEENLRGLLIYAFAMALHFLVTDYGLRQDHKQTYQRIGRWILAVAICAGWLLGLAVEIHQAGVSALFAFLAGGVVLNVLKEELPAERRSRFWSFAAGAAGFTLLLLAR